MRRLRRLFGGTNPSGILPLLLLIPITAAAFAPPPSTETVAARRSPVLHALTRLVEAAPGWHVAVRSETPGAGEWSLILWHDGPRHPGLVDSRELVVLSQTPVADAIVVTSFCPRHASGAPLGIASICDPGFPDEARRDIRFCSEVLGACEDADAERLVREVLSVRVRELELDGLMLTSPLD